MEKLEIKGNIVLWTIGPRKWLVNFEELTKAYICGRHPHTLRELSTATLNKILYIIRRLGGEWWIPALKRDKNHQRITLFRLQQLKASGIKIGSGKYATVYSLDGKAIKVINHRFYKHLPTIDGKVEKKVLSILKNKITYSCVSPNIITMYQYTPDKKTDYIILEKVNRTFWTYLLNKPNEHIVKGIILQILFTLTVVTHVLPGFRHNDLKVDNILLDFTPRTQPLTLHYKKQFWRLPSDIPLVKIADFDYSYIPRLCINPKVGTSHANSFGCTKAPSEIYDVHLFLNSLYTYRKKLGAIMNMWLQQQLPEKTRGNETSAVKFGRLKKPTKWEGVIRTPVHMLTSSFFLEFRTIHPTFPIWGI